MQVTERKRGIAFVMLECFGKCFTHTLHKVSLELITFTLDEYQHICGGGWSAVRSIQR